MILKFPDADSRANFLTRMEGARIANIRLKPSFAQPTVVIVRAADDVTDQLLESKLSPYLDAGVKIFGDIQFQVLA